MDDLILELAAFVVSAAIAVGTFYIRRWTGIEVEAKHREALHEAVISGVESAMAHGIEMGTETFLDHVKVHLRRSVPDALKWLDPLPDALENIIKRYIVERTNATIGGEFK